MDLHVVDEGEGPPVLLLHGFPDSSEMWRYLIPALVAANFRVVAPDLRGFGKSDKPQSVAAYRMPLIFDDLARILDAASIDRAHNVGHDWGAIAAWGFAGSKPERVNRLVATSVGHPRSFVRASASQLRPSWYAAFFQLPRLPERMLQRHDWSLLRRVFGSSPDFERYVEDMSRPGALRAGLNWYRANGWPHRLARYPRVDVPTMGIWGSGDPTLRAKQMTGSHRYVDAPWRYECVDNAGHWVPLSANETFNRLVIDWLSE